MKVIITGGGGFLGSMLCKRLMAISKLTASSGQQEPIEEIVLFDKHFSPEVVEIASNQLGVHSSPKVTYAEGGVDDRDAVRNAVGTDASTSIFHLASMVSGECEERFDDALRVNMEGGLNVFEAARSVGCSTRVVFASSIASFGGDAMQTPCTDVTKLTPQTTYGMTKVICELLINDYSRKGFFDGRSARLPTVIIRPGKPNAAASSWASGMFREPLRGVPCLLPVDIDQQHPMTGYRTVIESLIAIHELKAVDLGSDRAIGLPAMNVTPRIAEAALKETANERGLLLGPIERVPDDRIQRIVAQWPTEIDGHRALRLGLPPVPSLHTLINHYLEDFC